MKNPTSPLTPHTNLGQQSDIIWNFTEIQLLSTCPWEACDRRPAAFARPGSISADAQGPRGLSADLYHRFTVFVLINKSRGTTRKCHGGQEASWADLCFSELPQHSWELFLDGSQKKKRERFAWMWILPQLISQNWWTKKYSQSVYGIHFEIL